MSITTARAKRLMPLIMPANVGRPSSPQSRRWTSQNVALLSTGGRPLSRGRYYTREEIADSGTYTNKREVFLEAHNLNPGTYRRSEVPNW